MMAQRISEDPAELALPPSRAKHSVKVGLRNHEVQRTIKRLRLRPRPENTARAIQLPLVELHVLMPHPDHRHPPLPRAPLTYIA